MADAAARDELRQQIIRNERWATVGRLISAVCHDITNRMQAVQGALSLATEEPSLSPDLQTYLSICEQETRRVSEEIEQLRSVYHPEGERIGSIDLAELLADVRAIISDLSAKRGIRTEIAAPADLPEIRHRAGQLRFVLLGLLLNLIDWVSPERDGHIWLQTRQVGPTVQIEISTEASVSAGTCSSQTTDLEMLEHTLGIPTFRQVIQAENGEVGLSWDDPDLNIWFSLPIL